MKIFEIVAFQNINVLVHKKITSWMKKLITFIFNNCIEENIQKIIKEVKSAAFSF